MDDLEEKIGSILNNPQMMQQLMSMAQALGSAPQPKQQDSPSPPPSGGKPEVDIAMLQQLSRLAGQSNIDPQQQALLKALSPYLRRDRISKLEKAMRAAKMAKIASFALGQRG